MWEGEDGVEFVEWHLNPKSQLNIDNLIDQVEEYYDRVKSYASRDRAFFENHTGVPPNDGRYIVIPDFEAGSFSMDSFPQEQTYTLIDTERLEFPLKHTLDNIEAEVRSEAKMQVCEYCAEAMQGIHGDL